MLEIHNVDILNKNTLNIARKRVKKNQILLFDTKRRYNEYLLKLKYRRNGKYDDIPHYIITKTGKVYKLFSENYNSRTFGNLEIDKRQIKIAIENLGWLNKNTITGVLSNWIGDPYRLDPFIKHWRGFYYWDAYPESQITSIVELCEILCKRNNIPYQSVPSHGYFENITKFKGIVCKSNFRDIYTDINPSFDFKIFNDNAKKTDR